MPTSKRVPLLAAWPASCKLTAVLVALQTALGCSLLIALLGKGCEIQSTHQQHEACSPEQWQVLAAAFVAQLCFAAVTLHAIARDDGFQLRTAGAAFSCLSGLMWLLFLAVVGHTLPFSTRVGYGLLAVALTALDLLLVHLSHQHMGWRSHSWLSCDLRRKHAAEQQQLRHAMSRYKTLSRTCLHIVLLSIVNGLVLALVPAAPGAATAAQASTPATSDPAGLQGGAAGLRAAKTGVLVSVSLTALPLLWLALARCAVRYSSKKLEVLATASLAVAELFPTLQLFFVFDPAYPWRQSLVVRILLLAAPMGIWMVLLPLTWSAFRSVMALLRQPWVQDATAGGGCAALAEGEDMQHAPELLKPLMQGTWLLKGSPQGLPSPHLAVSKSSSKQALSLVATPSSGSNSLAVHNPTTAGKSICLLSTARPSRCQAFLQACGVKRHQRFFQLSVDGTTLRWSWNKYVLLYFVDSMSCDPAQLTVTLLCMLEPDLQLTFPDASTWSQWVAGLQLALQLVTGVAVPAAAAAAAEGQEVCPTEEVPASGGQLSEPWEAEASSAPSSALLQHQLVRAALFSQQGLQQLHPGGGCAAAHKSAPASGRSGLAAFLHHPRRHSQCDPAGLQLVQAQAMAQHLHTISAYAGQQGGPTMCALSSFQHGGPQPIRCAATLPQQRPADDPAQPTATAWQQEGGHDLQLPAQLPMAHTECPEGAASGGVKPGPALQTMFGAFRVPAGLQVPLQAAAASQRFSSSSGICSSPAGSANKPAACMPTACGGASCTCQLQPQPQVPSVLNAGYSLSPLGAEHRLEQQQLSQRQWQQAHETHLAPSKQRQLLQWLQQQSSGSCGFPESNGAQGSPCFSLDSGQLHSGGAAEASQLLPSVLQQQRSNSSTPPSAGSGGGMAQGAGHWAAQHLSRRPFEQQQQQHFPRSSFGLGRSLSLPAPQHVGDPNRSQPARPYSPLCNSSSEGYMLSSPTNSGPQAGSGESAAGQLQQSGSPEPGSSPQSSEEQPVTVQQLQERAAMQAAAAAAAAGSSSTCAAASGTDGSSSQAAAASLAQQCQEPPRQHQWGGPSLRGILSALGSVTRRTRDRTVSIAGAISGQGAGEQLQPEAAADEEADSSNANQPEQQQALERTSMLDRLGSLRSFLVGGDSNGSMSVPAADGGTSFRSSRSMNRGRRISFAWRGSFAARSTWSDWDDPASLSQITLEDSIGGGSSVSPSAAAGPSGAADLADEAAACEAQQQPQQQGYQWGYMRSRDAAPVLTPVLSVSSEDLHNLTAQQQQGVEAPAGSTPAMPAADAEAAAPQAGMDLHSAYQLATQAGSGSQKLRVVLEAGGAGEPDQPAAADKQQQYGSAHTPSWLIPAAAGAVCPEDRSADSSSACQAPVGAGGGATDGLQVRVPAGRSPAQLGMPFEPFEGDHVLQLQQRWQQQQQRSSSPPPAVGMAHSASTPHLQRDDSYVIKSPTPSQASLHSHFSHTSIASHWWLEGCGGSPTSVRSKQWSAAAGSDSGSGSGRVQGFSSSLPAGLQSAAAGSGGAAHEDDSAGFRFPAAVPQHGSTGSGLKPGSGAGALLRMDLDKGSADKVAASTASLERGDTPQVPVEVISWAKLHRGRRLGQGSEGTVLEARYRDAPVAIKEGAASSEIAMFLAAGSHDNLVGLRGLTRKPDGTWCLVLEHCGRGTLDMLLHHSMSPLGRPPPSAAKMALNAVILNSESIQQQQAQLLTRSDVMKVLPLIRGVARGLLHLHTRQPAILHRDVKPANILIGHGMQMKIGDLGMARHIHAPSSSSAGMAVTASSSRPTSPIRMRQAQASQHSPRPSDAGGSGSSSGACTPKGPAARTFTPGIVGTITYTAPEVLGVLEEGPGQQQPSVETMLKADVYSLGVTLWECVERQRPWQGLDGMQLWTMWVSDPAAVTLPLLTINPMAGAGERDVLATLQQLVLDCTALNPEERPNMEAVLDKIRAVQKMYDDLKAAGAAPASASGSGPTESTASVQDAAIDSRADSPAVDSQ